MKIPYFTDRMTRKIAKKLGTSSKGGINVTFLGFILYQLACTPKSLDLLYKGA